MSGDAGRALAVALGSFAVLAVGAGLGAWFGTPQPMGVALVGASVVGFVGALDGVAAAVHGWPSKSTVAVGALAVVVGVAGSSGGILTAAAILLRSVWSI